MGGQRRRALLPRMRQPQRRRPLQSHVPGVQGTSAPCAGGGAPAMSNWNEAIQRMFSDQARNDNTAPAEQDILSLPLHKDYVPTDDDIDSLRKLLADGQPWHDEHV